MIAAQVSAENTASGQFNRLVPAVRESLQAEVERLSAKLVHAIRDDFLSGPRPEHLEQKSGALAASIAAEPLDGNGVIGGSVGSGMGADSYAGAWESGFEPHSGPRGGISAARKKFDLRRSVLTVRKVSRPASLRAVAVCQRRPFVHPAFEAMQDEIVSGLAEAGTGSIEGVFA
jgi:hypothetical protein